MTQTQNSVYTDLSKSSSATSLSDIQTLGFIFWLDLIVSVPDKMANLSSHQQTTFLCNFLNGIVSVSAPQEQSLHIYFFKLTVYLIFVFLFTL